MDFFDLKQTINEQVMAFIEENYNEVDSETIGLDQRCGRVWVGDEGIAIRYSKESVLSYYGGFQYVDKEHITQLGDYIFYSIDDSRIEGHCEYLITEEE